MENTFIVDQKLLFSILLSMQPICTKRTALDATSSILFQVGHKELVLKSTDLEISLQASCQLIESNVDKNCSFLVPGRRIFEVVKELEGPISCILTGTQLSLQAGDVFLSLNVKEAQEFPPFPERIENLMHIDASLLLKMVESVGFLIPQNNGNPALNGLLVELTPEFLKMTTTDGHSLAQASTTKTQFKESRTWLLPRRAIFELKKILETVEDKTLFLGMCGNQLVFSGELFNFFTKILVDQFPDYRAILSKDEFVPAKVDRSRFLKTLRRSACLLLANQFVPTKFSFTHGSVRVSMTNKEVGTLDEQVPVSGAEHKQVIMYLYTPFLLHGIQAFHDNDLMFYVKSGVTPIFFESHTDDFSMTYLVMPVSPTVARQDIEGIS